MNRKIKIESLKSLILKMDEFENDFPFETKIRQEYELKFQPFKEQLIMQYSEYLFDQSINSNLILSEQEYDFVMEVYISCENYERAKKIHDKYKENLNNIV